MVGSGKKPQELYALGLSYLNGSRLDLAVPIFEELAGQMHSLSLYQLGHLYLEGKMFHVLRKDVDVSLDQDYEAKGTAYLRAAAGLGVLNACYELGSWLTKDESNLDEAGFWLKKAADEGHIKASLELGWLFHSTRKYHLAESYYKRAAGSGDADAAYSLARLYFSNCLKPFGFKRKIFSALTEEQQIRIENYKRAFGPLVEAANRGHAEAQYKLGLLLTEGLNELGAEICPKDESAANTLLKKAAAQGHRGAAQVLKDPGADHPRRGLG